MIKYESSPQFKERTRPICTVHSDRKLWAFVGDWINVRSPWRTPRQFTCRPPTYTVTTIRVPTINQKQYKWPIYIRNVMEGQEVKIAIGSLFTFLGTPIENTSPQQDWPIGSFDHIPSAFTPHTHPQWQLILHSYWFSNIAAIWVSNSHRHLTISFKFVQLLHFICSWLFIIRALCNSTRRLFLSLTTYQRFIRSQ